MNNGNAVGLLGSYTTTDGAEHVVQITGDSQDAVDLSHLFADGHATGTWAQSGAVQQGGQTFNVYSYSADASLQVLVDQHLQHVTLS